MVPLPLPGLTWTLASDVWAFGVVLFELYHSGMMEPYVDKGGQTNPLLRVVFYFGIFLDFGGLSIYTYRLRGKGGQPNPGLG